MGEIGMRCERCGETILEGEAKERYGQVLCEDCYIDLLSPLKACDPWAVHSAKAFTERKQDGLQLTPIQEKILDTLRTDGPMSPEQLAKKLQIKETDLEREIASLRHMEKVRGDLKEGRRVVCLWSSK